MADIDLRLATVLGDRGVFVEAGANDGFRQSNTYYLERFRGWTGVLVEPIPQLADLAHKRRMHAHVFNCALVASSFSDDTVTIRYGDLRSEIGSTRIDASWGWEPAYDVVVPARTLTSVLDAAGIQRVDFLSLDVEGYEASVLDGFDVERFAPRFILLEVLPSELPALLTLVPGYGVREWLTDHDVLLARAIERSEQPRLSGAGEAE